ncbi:MAG TPA: ABC transporter permease, partial [Solirubrobacter sp.]
EPVVIVNDTLARTQSAGRDPVGRTIVLGSRSARIIGVVADIHDDGLDVPVTSRVYFPILQRSNNALTLFYRSTTDPASLNTSVERAIHAVDPTLPVYGQSTMEQLLAGSMVRRMAVMSLMGGFAAVALLLAAVGTSGVMSVAAGQRVREIGIRVALGAQRGDIRRCLDRVDGRVPHRLELRLLLLRDDDRRLDLTGDRLVVPVADVEAQLRQLVARRLVRQLELDDGLAVVCQRGGRHHGYRNRGCDRTHPRPHRPPSFK